MSAGGLKLDDASLRALLYMSLREDVGDGDLTSLYTVPEDLQACARVIARQDLVLCGSVLFAPLVEELARLCPGSLAAGALRMSESRGDGAALGAGETAVAIEGPARALLTVERTFLNYLGHLSGISTETAKFVEAVRGAGYSTRILDTRKTTPGMRSLEKYAVACGGGSNHRMGLFDAVLIKDNHVVAAGGIKAAVTAALAGAGDGVEVEVECDDMGQLREAMEAGATAVLLDNFTPGEVREAVTMIAGRARIEVSGGIRLDSVVAYAEAGADDVSIGWLTHSSPCADFSMEVSLLA